MKKNTRGMRCGSTCCLEWTLFEPLPTRTRAYHMLYLNGGRNFASPIQNRIFEDAFNWLIRR